MNGAVSRRPQRGSAYATSCSRTDDNWNKIDEPGGRKLWFRLVAGFTLLAIFGTGLLALGAALFQHSWDYHHDGHTALPMVLCIIAMVCGTLMFFGSIILGKMVISNKWRRNEKPNYNRRNRVANARVHYTVSSNDASLAQAHIDFPPPPPYEADRSPGAPPTVYNMDPPYYPPPPDLLFRPPEYSEEAMKPPSYSSVNPVPEVHTIKDLPQNTEPSGQ